MENVINEKKSSFLLSIIKGTLFALSTSLILVLIFAFILKFAPIGDSAIMPINQVIKCISILIGTFTALKNKKEMGLITGLLVGLSYTLIAFLVFSILDGNFAFGKTLINDIFFGGIIGSICGVIAVSFKK